MNHQQMVKPLLIAGLALVALGLAGFPVLAYAPLLILLVCPLMMFFMMGSMDHGGHHDEHEDRTQVDDR